MNHKIKTLIKPVKAFFIPAALMGCAITSTATTAYTCVNDFLYAFEKVATNTWIMHGPRELPNPRNKGFMNNPAFVKTSAGLVIIDPGSTVRRYIQHPYSRRSLVSKSGNKSGLSRR